jgi:hypothetical protein
MNETIAYCGLVCQGCPINWATRESNDEKRRKMRTEIALQIKKQGGGEYKPQDITDCDGCKTENGRLFPGCKECEISNEYACERLDRFFTTYPEPKSRLDVIRSAL